MNDVIRKYSRAFFELFSTEFAKLLKEKKVSITNKGNTVKIRFRLDLVLEEIRKVDSKKENLLAAVDAQTIKNLLKSAFGVTTEQAAFYGSTRTCYCIGVDLIKEITGVSFSITEDNQPATTLFEDSHE